MKPTKSIFNRAHRVMKKQACSSEKRAMETWTHPARVYMDCLRIIEEKTNIHASLKEHETREAK